MNLETVRRLNTINRAFYRERATEFDATRGEPWPGWERLPPLLEASPASRRELAVLDVGCGNGRFAAFLAKRWSATAVRYIGVDGSPALLERARERVRVLPGDPGDPRVPGVRARWLLADFVDTEPAEALPTLQAPEVGFSLVVVFGVLHHIPSAARRRALLRAAATRLAPGGLLVTTSWRLEAFRRFRDRLVPWDRYNAGCGDPVDIGQLEPGDHLLPWGDAGSAVRYCHFSSEAETTRALDELPLEPVVSFCADGREGRLNRYFVHRARGEARASS